MISSANSTDSRPGQIRHCDQPNGQALTCNPSFYLRLAATLAHTACQKGSPKPKQTCSIWCRNSSNIDSTTFTSYKSCITALQADVSHSTGMWLQQSSNTTTVAGERTWPSANRFNQYAATPAVLAVPVRAGLLRSRTISWNLVICRKMNSLPLLRGALTSSTLISSAPLSASLLTLTSTSAADCMLPAAASPCPLHVLHWLVPYRRQSKL